MAKACEPCHIRKIKCDLPLSRDRRSVRCSFCENAGLECRPHVRKRRTVVGPNETRRATIDSTRLATRDGVASPSSRPSPRDPGAATAQQETPTSMTAAPPQATSNPIQIATASPPSSQPSFLGRATYMTSGDLVIDEDDATKYESNGTGTSLVAKEYQQCQVLRSSSVISSLQQSMISSLVQSFMDKGRPWMPIVDQTDLEPTISQPHLSLFLTSVLVAGSKLSTSPHALEWGEKCYLHAKTLFFYGPGQNPLQSVIATVLLQWWNSAGPEHVSLDSSTIWLKLAVGLAHQMGLHRESDPSLPDARLRRRLWWTIVNRDNQIATSHGRPRVLDPRDSNVKHLHLGDFPNLDQVDSLRFIFFVRINSILGDMVSHYRRGSLSERRRMDTEEALLRWLKELPPSLHLHDQTSRALRSYQFKSRQLHIPFFIAVVILYRPEAQSSQTTSSLASLIAASFVTRIFSEFIDWGDISFLAPPFIFYLLVAGLNQVSSHRHPDLSQHADQEIQTVRDALNELKKRFPTAVGAERVFENILCKARALQPCSQPSPPKPLSPTQQELLAYFGPDLCPLWPSFLSESVDPVSLLLNIPSADRTHFSAQQNLSTNNTVNAPGEVDVLGQIHNGDVHAVQSFTGMPVSEPVGDFDFGRLDLLWSDWLDSTTT
ncbi:unnamed protein product [Clonostachys byssicola]|uniref:Zn(2)-C6 fungal-type domain-containing protein n=1 Tax=Clonostachys byssicola TaxID=160290 RepID=A0A9N9Y8G9_9HYPO|nr:unnamed protein product [Clonostachys byssicola]